jgi:hypothetical protein
MYCPWTPVLGLNANAGINSLIGIFMPKAPAIPHVTLQPARPTKRVRRKQTA